MTSIKLLLMGIYFAVISRPNGLEAPSLVDAFLLFLSSIFVVLAGFMGLQEVKEAQAAEPLDVPGA